MHWGFYEEALRVPAWPEVPCPTRIVHGTRDAVVPVGSSRRYAAARPHVTLVEVDDAHELAASLDLVAAETLAFFDIG